MNPTEWAKQNKKQLVQQIVGNAQSAPDDEKPLALFAAGVPGAGKTEFLDSLLAHIPDIVRIDMDEIVKLFDGYSPENYYRFRGAANIIVDEVVIYCRRHHLDFALDGTFASPRAVENVRSALKRHNVAIVYVWKEPSLAWQHTKDRQLVTKRGIEKVGFIKSCIDTPMNIRTAKEKFGNKIAILAIKKDIQNNTFQLIRDPSQIDNLLEKHYTESILERTLS